MDVTVETTGALERRLKIQIPEERVQGEVDKRLLDMARSARLPGFRPGKAPVKVIRQRFGRQIRSEVVGEMVQSSFHDALVQEELQPAGMPTIDPVEASPGNGVEYVAVFDVYPNISLPPIEALEVARPRAEVEERNVDNMIETLRHQRRTWEEVERAAQSHDRVIVDFQGTVDGEPLEQGGGTEVPVELDAGRMIVGFEAGLVGVNAGDERVLDLSFPESYQAPEVAGKPVTFTVNVHRVEQSVLPEIDDEFVASFGLEEGGIDGLRAEVRSNMVRELDDSLRNLTKQRVMDALLAGNTLDLPKALIDQEIERAYQQRVTELAHAGIGADQHGLEAAMFEDQARRRVTLGLLLAEIIKVNHLDADPERVRARIETIASTYEDPERSNRVVLLGSTATVRH